MKTHFGIIAIFCTSLSACLTVQDNSINIPVPVVVDVVPNTIHVCKITPFTDTYQAENTSRGRAFLDVKKQCTANLHEMFCADEKITCTEYK
ncbi:hypothetical protein [Moraxella oblonga]|uniref:hypothetical protein n=1 Tax=Moraxella oblonga TaxID=200413 RepID=UPI00082C2739|nr:hypothetical protein [Moraxella oblonga]